MRNFLLICIPLLIIYSCREGKNSVAENTRDRIADSLGTQLISVWESGDTGRLNRILHPDMVYLDMPNGQTFKGIEGAAEYINHIHQWGSEISMQVRHKRISGDFGYFEWQFQARQSSPIGNRIPIATNRPVSLNGVTLIEIKDGKIIRAADYMDVMGFVLQLGSRVELPGGVIIGDPGHKAE